VSANKKFNQQTSAQAHLSLFLSAKTSHLRFHLTLLSLLL